MCILIEELTSFSYTCINISLQTNAICGLHYIDRYHDVGRLSDQQMALLQYQRENLHFLSEEVLLKMYFLHAKILKVC